MAEFFQPCVIAHPAAAVRVYRDKDGKIVLLLGARWQEVSVRLTDEQAEAVAAALRNPPDWQSP